MVGETEGDSEEYRQITWWSGATAVTGERQKGKQRTEIFGESQFPTFRSKTEVKRIEPNASEDGRYEAEIKPPCGCERGGFSKAQMKHYTTNQNRTLELYVLSILLNVGHYHLGLQTNWKQSISSSVCKHWIDGSRQMLKTRLQVDAILLSAKTKTWHEEPNHHGKNRWYTKQKTKNTSRL